MTGIFIQDEHGNMVQMGGITEIEPETEPIGDLPDYASMKSEEFSMTISGETADEMRRALIPRGMRNAAILRRDGYLDVKNAELW